MMLTRRARDERGATATLVALLSTVLFAAAALAVDYSSLVMERQNLHDHIDSAAHAGAFELPGNGAGAATAARTIALAQDGAINPTVSLLCVVASTGSAPSYTPNTLQIPSTCYPGPAPYSASNYPGLACNAYICAIPCPTTGTGIKCNTVKVSDNKTVGYNFARILGINNGNTGSVSSAACKGSCGAEVPNPLDIVIMADRTASMQSADRAQMKMAILNSLKTMTPSLHHVAFGALAKSRTSDFTPKSSFVRPTVPATPAYEDCSQYRRSSDRTACNNRNAAKQAQYDADVAAWEAGESSFSKSTGWDGTGETDGNGYCATEAVRLNGRNASSTRSEGTWIPIDFSNDYLDQNGNLVGTSALVDAISCLPESTTNEYGTNLGASLKAAVRKAMGGSTVPGASSRPGTPRKVVIFETDGQPDEVGNASGSTAVTDDQEVWSGTQGSGNGPNGCSRFNQVATNAKAQGVIIITIGFGDAGWARCRKSENDFERKSSAGGSSSLVRDVLAAAASDSPSGGPSAAGDCQSSAGIAAENSDGDYFFCAANGDELSDIFKTALSQVSGNIRLIKLP